MGPQTELKRYLLTVQSIEKVKRLARFYAMPDYKFLDKLIEALPESKTELDKLLTLNVR